MVEQIAWIALFAVIAALSVPATMAGLARLGYFEPLEFAAFGHYWRIGPRINPVKTLATRRDH